MVFRKTHEESGSKTTRLKSCRKTYTVGGQYLLSFVLQYIIICQKEHFVGSNKEITKKIKILEILDFRRI